MLRALALLAVTAVAGCQCRINQDDLTNIPDAGQEIDDAGPPPPVFPLKAGDTLQYVGLGGRTLTCEGGGAAGSCQRALNADYIIRDTVFEDNRWTVVADVVYQGTDDTIPATAIAPLILENGAPFSRVTEGTPESAEDVAFSTDQPATEDLTPNGFPFFQAESGAAEVFETAGQAFCDRYKVDDADAACDFQTGARLMDVYFVDDSAGGGAKLHKVAVEYHQFGFICGWDEGLIPFVDEATTPRSQSSFGNQVTPDLAAQFVASPKVIRDGVTYTCSCFTQTCRAGNGADARCLSLDPDEEPGPCEEQ